MIHLAYSNIENFLLKGRECFPNQFPIFPNVLIDIIWEAEALYKKDVRCLDEPSVCLTQSVPVGCLYCYWSELLTV